MSNLRKTLVSMAAGIAALTIAASAAIAQTGHSSAASQAAPDASAKMGPGMMMEQGAPGPGMMDPEMMRMMMMRMMTMMDADTGMKSQDKTGPGMMAPGAGKRVTPIQHLSTEDVRHFLEHSLEMRANPRLKVGEVQEVDEDTIVADIVTVDDSLVERWKIDRHTGEMVSDTATDEGPEN
jgi:hypothetical protein